MKKLKFLLATALVTVSGAALAEMIQPLYNPASVYNPATGQYEAGCGTAYFRAPYGTTQTISPMLNGASTEVWAGGYTITVSCSGGTLTAWANAYEGDLTN